MIKSYKEIIGTPILKNQDGELLGIIYDVIIDPETGKIEAFWIKCSTLPIGNGILQNSSILDWKYKIYIKGEQEISLPDEIIKITEILSKKILFIGNTVRNESGDRLGKIYDLEFDTTNYLIKNLYSSKIFLGFKFNKRIFSFENIIEALPDHILVKDIQSREVRDVVELNVKHPIMDA